jgi:hypothetical protein
LKEEALDRVKWGNRFGRGCGPVVWQITDEDDDSEVLFRGIWHTWYFVGAEQERTRPGSKIPQGTKFCTVSPNICGSWTWDFLHVAHLAPQNFVIDRRCLETVFTRDVKYIKQSRHSAWGGKYCSETVCCIKSSLEGCDAQQNFTLRTSAIEELWKWRFVAQNCWNLFLI